MKLFIFRFVINIHYLITYEIRTVNNTDIVIQDLCPTQNLGIGPQTEMINLDITARKRQLKYTCNRSVKEDKCTMKLQTASIKLAAFVKPEATFEEKVF